MRHLLFTLFLLLTSFAALSQDLIKGLRNSPYTYIFSLSNKDAAKAYGDQLQDFDPSYTRVLVDSFPTGRFYPKKLPYGNYLFVHAKEDQLVLKLESVRNVSISLLPDTRKLMAAVFDTAGVLVQNADVRLNRKPLRYHAATNTYQRRFTNNHQLLVVEHQGLQNFFFLEQLGMGRSLSRKVLHRVIYFKPVYMVWKPFRDVVNTIRWGGLQGWLQFFDPYLDWEERFGGQNFRGYLALNQPLYRQGDTVYYKAFVMKKNKPFKKPLELTLSGKTRNGYKNFTLSTVAPYRKGAYDGFFVLHDSLGFLQDSYALLALRRKNRELQQQFKLEDYELKGNSFSMRASRNKHVAGAPPTLIMQGMDVNGLSLLGAELQLVAVANRVDDLMGQRFVTVPDTLWRHKLTLAPVGDTQLVLPDSIFKNTGISYTLYGVLKTPQQEYLKQQLSMYYAPEAMVDLELLGDSLHIRFLKQGKPVPQEGDIDIYTHGNEEQTLLVSLPYKIKIDPLWKEVEVWAGGEYERLTLSSKPSLVAHTVARSGDSLFVNISSGRNLPFWYSLYAGKRKKKKISSGYSAGDAVFLARKSRRNKPYFLQVNWVWGGELQQAKEDVPLLKKILNLELDAPEQVKPGEKVALGVRVTNMDGKPVEGVDLTTFAYNKKMPGSLNVQVPYLGKERWSPLYLRERRRQEKSVSGKTDMDWQQWHERLGLDSIAFYQFLYPGEKLYTYQVPAPAAATQFAPYVIEKGIPQQVHIIYLNNVPIYYSEVQTERPYSFMVNPYQTYKLSLRTATHLISFDSICFDKGQKSILSLSKELQHPRVKIEEMLPSLSQQELDHLNRYLLVVNHTYNQQYAFLEQGDLLQLVSSPSNYHQSRQVLAGPFSPGPITYEVVDNFKTSFPLETGYQYRIKPELVFAKETTPEREPKLDRVRTQLTAGEMVLTAPKVRQLWQDYLAQRNRGHVKYEYPSQTKAGAGRIALHYQIGPGESPRQGVQLQEVVVLSLNDTAFVQVYPVKQNLMLANQLLHDLAPGRYKLLALLDNKKYLLLDSLPVQANATTHLNLAQAEIKLNDEYIEQLRKIIDSSRGYRPWAGPMVKQELNHINQLGRMERPSGGSILVQGKVSDELEGMGLPGVAVRIKGTQYGTVTDIDGNYQLYVNPGDELVFSFVGYQDQHVNTDGKSVINATLREDVEQLSEVVVTAYGAQEKRSMLSASVSHVLNGRAAGITIRGTSSIQGESKPLIIIDGVPYEGDLGKLDPSLVSSALILKGAEAISLYGSRGAAGVIIISSGKPQQDKEKAGALLAGAVSQENSLRTNFRDWAFWQPRLQTDAQGKAGFTITFPDNITAWDAKVLAMGKKRYSGQLNKTIRAVKPLWASLAYPRFLLSGDSTMVYGQVNNYSHDTLDISTRFTFGTQPQALRRASLTSSLLDSVWVSTISTDSLSITYEVLGHDGLLDGERRKLPVYRAGVREARGEFFILRPDSARSLMLAAAENPWQLQAFASTREPLLREVYYLLDYPYYCNEQAASKLYALLVYNKLRQDQDKMPQQQHHIKKLIRQLVEAQREDGMWGWWQGNSGEYWITRHVAGALQMAKEAGYSADFNTVKLLEALNWRLNGTLYPYEQLALLEVLAQLKDQKVPYQQFIPVLEDSLKKDELARLRLLRLRSKAGLDFTFTAADVLALKHETILGAYYWGNERGWNPEHTSLIATAWAYDLLRQKGATAEMDKAELYLWENRPGGYWRNTYESAQVLMNLLPREVVLEKRKPSLSLEANGATTRYETLPLEKPLILAADQVALKNTGNTPVYLNAYTESWIEKPEAVAGDFTISTHFSNGKSQLKVGESVEMVVELEVKKSAEYVMIEIPIPAGCTYESKAVNWREIHREYFRDRVVIFCRKLPEGKHSYKINLQPRFKGTYTLNPAQVSLMYFPTIFGRTGIKQVEIR